MATASLGTFSSDIDASWLGAVPSAEDLAGGSPDFGGADAPRPTRARRPQEPEWHGCAPEPGSAHARIRHPGSRPPTAGRVRVAGGALAPPGSVP